MLITLLSAGFFAFVAGGCIALLRHRFATPVGPWRVNHYHQAGGTSVRLVRTCVGRATVRHSMDIGYVSHRSDSYTEDLQALLARAVERAAALNEIDGILPGPATAAPVGEQPTPDTGRVALAKD